MQSSNSRAAVLYGVTLALFGVAMWGILHFGKAKFGGGDIPTLEGEGGGIGAMLLHGFKAPVSQLLLQLIVIVGLARLFGVIFQRFGQPAVIGEMFAGLALGPSLVGALSPGFTEFVFPAQSLGPLQLLSQLGVLLFMFAVGMELDTALIRRHARSALLVSHISIIFPFLLGAALALLLFKDYAGEKTGFLPFCLFMGISMSITAFPVLARILQERGLTQTPLGTTAIACAAVDDVTAWCALAFIVAIAKAQAVEGAVATVVLSGLFVAAVLKVLAPSLEAVLGRVQNPARPGRAITVLCLLCLFGCALTTEVIGIHALFGAFLAGVATPKNEAFRTFLRERLEYFSTLFLLPIFFAFTGLRTQVGLLNDTTSWAICALVIAVAVLGKLVGSAAAARATGQSWREATAIGVLMNTRGLMELIALNLGFDLGVLSPKIFTMLVLMALVTTFATGPLLALLGYRQGSAVPARAGLAGVQRR